MKVIFKRMIVDSFKGIEHFEVEFNNGETKFIGANETGKSTLADAISFLFVGKNSLGQSNFEIVPVNQTGVSPTVEMEIEIINGDEKRKANLKKVSQAKLNRAKEFTGEYSTVCYVNNAKMSLKEFDTWIDEHIVKREIFNLIFDCRYFTENISATTKERPWEIQRRLLLSICPIKSDIQLAKKARKWATIAEGLERYDNVSVMLNALKTQYNELAKKANGFTAAISALEDAKTEYDEERHKQVTANIEQIRRELNIVGTKKDELTAERDKAIQEKRKTLESEEAKVKDMKNEVAKRELEKAQKETQLYTATANLSNLNHELDCYRADFKAIKKSCPTCGQSIPEEILASTATKLKNNAAICKNKIAKAECDIESLKSKIETLKNLIADINANIDKKNEAMYQSIYGADTYSDEIVRLNAEFYDLGRKLAAAQREEEQILAGIRQNQSIESKIEQREKENKENVEAISELLKQIDTCRAFISYKCKAAEEEINSMFDGVTFKMFRPNKTNDDIRECCDIYWHDVPYASLSYSTKFIVALKIAKAFQKYYGIEFPLIIDNAESIDFDTSDIGQIIQLSKQEEFCPKCGGKTGRRGVDGLWICVDCGNKFKKTLKVIDN